MTHDELIERLRSIAARKDDVWFCNEMGNTYTLCLEIESILTKYLGVKDDN